MSSVDSKVFRFVRDVYQLGRGFLRATGRDIVRLEQLAALNAEIDNQKKLQANLREEIHRDSARTDIVKSLENALDFERRYQEAYRLEKNVIPLKADRYSYEKNVNNDELLVFKAQNHHDFNWLEYVILQFGYYEKPGVWRFTIDDDKRMLAELIATFKPGKTLDFGCANGPLVQALADLGVNSEGVEISAFALQHAFPGIKSRIHHGDLLNLPLTPASYDVVSGLDIFEHLNPNKIDACIEKLHELITPGGHIFANIPAFGRDEVFGEVFDYYMPDWEQQRDGSSYFKTLHCDMHGYPVNGHLIWADTKWWVELFKKHGFERCIDKEKSLHEQFGHRLYHSRRSFYVFRKVG